MTAAGRLMFGLLIWAFTFAPANAASIKAETMGLLLARSACSYCHVVSKDQDFQPPLQPRGPAFSEIAADPKTSRKQLRRFLLTTHKDAGAASGMPNPLLNNAQIEQIVSFILSQRP